VTVSTSKDITANGDVLVLKTEITYETTSVSNYMARTSMTPQVNQAAVWDGSFTNPYL
jgi:hypothetical protein